MYLQILILYYLLLRQNEENKCFLFSFINLFGGADFVAIIFYDFVRYANSQKCLV